MALESSVLRYAMTAVVEIMFTLLIIILSMLVLHLLRMGLTTVTRNILKPTETLSEGEEDQNYETCKKTLSDVTEIRSKISQIKLEIQLAKRMMSALQGKVESLERKQDATLSLLERWRVCQAAGG